MNAPKLLLRSMLLVLLVLTGALTACGGEPPGGTSSGPKAFGERCARTEDCASGLCVRVDEQGGICSRACEQDSGCPTSDNWACLSADEQSFSVCACAPLGPDEICGDGLDNECNGRVDDCRICDGRPVPKNDHDNCGACGNNCRNDQACENGDCTCLASVPNECNGSCANTATDERNCGACGSSCGLEQTCESGECTCPTDRPSHCPGQGCFNLQANSEHCGECGNTCPAGQLCLEGECSCPSSSHGEYCPGVGCVDTQSSAKYCGDCETSCLVGQLCEDGECVCAGGLSLCDDACVSLSTDTENCGECGNTCPAGVACISGKCSCAGEGYSVCGDSCVALNSDTQNCGKCGRECSQGEQCAGGECYCTSQVYCGDECMPQNDDDNCGACGTSCPVGQSCSGGDCVCDGFGLSICDDECVDLASDEQHCGTCDKACRNGEECNYGCACPYGQTYCENAGTCVPLGTDEQHCGSCDKACNPTETCTGGSCDCATAGQLYCAGEGGCIDTWYDEQHCGACDKACNPTETCSGGSCSCPGGYTNQFCASENACVDLYFDADHCGECDNACPAGTHCSYGGCVCDTAGQTLCDDSCFDLSTDADHCGACDNDCGGTYVCSGGACNCPDPTVGTAVRVTNDAGNDWGPAAAFNGTNVGVVYMRTTSDPYANVRLAILKPDGSVVSDKVIATYASRGARMSPAITWSGSEFAVSWVTENDSGSQVLVQRFNAAGTSKGAPVDIGSDDGWSSYSPALAWSTSYAGYGAAYGKYGVQPHAVFRRIGATGTVLEAENQYSLNPEFDTQTQVVVAPDKTWGVNAFGTILVYNEDGSRTLAPLATDRTASLVHDGANWLTTGIERYYSHSLRAWRGLGNISTTILSPEAGNSGYVDNASTMARGTLAVALKYGKPSSTDYALRLQRFKIPESSTSSALTSLHDTVEILPTSNLPDAYNESRNFTLVTTSSGLLAIWADNRWGAAKEIYAAPIDLKSCP